MSLQVKIIILVCAITILCGVGSALLSGRIMHQIMEMHLISTTTSICQALGENISENVYNGEAVKARITLQEVADKIEGMEYAYIIDFDGRLFAHTFEGSFPEDLVTAEHHTLVRADEPLVTRYMASGVPIIDVAYPIVDGTAGHIHIGISETGMHSRIADLRNQILGFTLLIMLIGAGFGTILSLRITRPIRRLADAIKDFGKGNSELKADFSSGGMEVVSLSESFNQMISEREQRVEQLQLLAKNMPAMINAMDEEGRFIVWNKECERITGYDAGEIIGNPNASEMLYPDPEYLAALMAGWEKRGSNFRNWEITLTCKDGSQKTVSWSNISDTHPIPGWASWSVGVDVTEQRQAEIELRRSEGRHRDIALCNSDWIWEVDAEGKYTYASERVLDVLGYRPEEIIGKTPFDLMPAEEAKRIGEVYAGIAQRKEALKDIENWNQAKDGSPVCLLTNGVPLLDELGHLTGYRGVDKDITERKRAEEALEQLAARNEAILASVPDIIMEVDKDKVYTWANKAGLVFFGDDVIGKEANYYFEGEQDTYERVRPIFDNATEDIIYVESWQRRQDGEKRLLCWWCRVLKDSLGHVTGSLSTGRDITDRRELEEKLRHAEKLEAIGQLAGGIAHDFNNIMTGIFGYCDLLEGELVRKSRASEYVREITDAAERAADLTSKLLAFSRKQVIEAIDLNINDAIEKAVGLLKRVLGEHIELDVIPGHNLGTVFADPSQISQIIMNLAVNARDAMLEGGKLTIETENVAINGAYCETHPWAKPGRYVLLSVADTGCGIPPDVLKHVFEPFFTTKDVDKGTGLGLATVYGIIKQHEGMVNIYSEVGKGTSVKIYLPIVERKAAEIGTKVEKKVLGGEETILLVEDDETVRQMTSRLLENAGYTIILATNGIEAVNIFRKKGDSIDLVLTDMMMPKMSGDEVCEKVRNIRENIKCIISSGYSIQSLPSALKGQSGIPILTKPFSPDALLRSVREVLDTGEGESAQN